MTKKTGIRFDFRPTKLPPTIIADSLNLFLSGVSKNIDSMILKHPVLRHVTRKKIKIK